MTNKNVIEIIDRLMDPKAEKLAATASEVFVAIVHGYYYIRPGKNTARFLDKINKVLKENWKDRPKMYVETKDGLPFEAYLWGEMAGEMLYIARSMFDEEYYGTQLKRMIMYEVYDEHLLERYMYWLSYEELEMVFAGLLTFKHDHDAFISDEKFEQMMEELKEKSIMKVQESSGYGANYDAHMDCIHNTLDFFFAYLCRESIIDTICKYVDVDPLMFASMIKAFKYSDVRTAAEYTSLAMWLVYGYELDLFDPTITDSQSLDNIDVAHSWQVCSRNVGKMKIDVKTA